ncbi:MAG: hypothetical protein KDD15_20210, partial [Lewinella sp.]|nr:hypothetical protein [Lewinella sp.]
NKIGELIEEIELLDFIPTFFGRNLIIRFLDTLMEKFDENEIKSILRYFLDCMFFDLTQNEIVVLKNIDKSELKPSNAFSEIHQTFFDQWFEVFQETETKKAEELFSVFHNLAGALGTILRPTIYENWDSMSSELPNWEISRGFFLNSINKTIENFIRKTKQLEYIALQIFSIYHISKERTRQLFSEGRVLLEKDYYQSPDYWSNLLPNFRTDINIRIVQSITVHEIKLAKANIYFDENSHFIEVRHLSSLLKNLEILHDLVIRNTAGEYEYFIFDSDSNQIVGHQLTSPQRMRIGAIEKKSPLAIEILFGSIAAFWAIVQTAERISNWRENRRKLVLERKILESKLREQEDKEKEAKEKWNNAVKERGLEGELEEIESQLEELPLDFSKIIYEGEIDYNKVIEMELRR